MLAQPEPTHKPRTLDANLARQFAWLLRKDLRDAYTTQDNPEFENWWLIKGRQEFPGWADAAPTDALQSLFEPAGTSTLGGVPITVPKVVSTLLKFRPDAAKELSSNGKLDNEKFFAWAMVRGLCEHKLAQHAPRSLVAMLDQPLPWPDGQPQTSDDSTPPAASLLMYLLWRLLDDKLQTARNLQTTEGRKAFMLWFFGVAPQLELGPLIAGRWLAWLQSPGATASLGPQATQLADALRAAAAALRAKHSPPGDAAQRSTEKPFGLNIYGFAYGELGIGEDLRMAVECCEAANIPFHVVNVDAGSARQADMHLKGKVSESTELPPYNTNLFCLPAFDTVSRVFMQKGAAVFEGYRNIGWWPWELSVFPKAWRPYAFELVDEVWASSQFLYDMYKQATHKPVKLVPLAVSVERMKPYPRSHYGLPEGKFLFLYIFDFNSSVARKNPMATVRAFKHAFALTDNSVGLVFKTMNTKPNNPEWLALINECQVDRRFQLITNTYDRPDVLGLINACDAYVSLHRAEGYGRTIAESILLKKPVIVTNYSGATDMLSKENSGMVGFDLVPVTNKYYWIEENDSGQWAEPDIHDAAMKMRKIRSGEQINTGGKVFSPTEVAEKMTNILCHKDDNWIDNPSQITYDNEWQIPSKTEKWIWERLQKEEIELTNVQIVSFPWATLIDLIERGKNNRANKLLERLRSIRLSDRKRITFCQHIKALEYSYLFERIGIDVLYWSHKRIGRNKHNSITLRPLPLYPVINNDDEYGDDYAKIYDYCFIGAYDAGCYLSDVRDRIFSYSHPATAYITKREKWHFEDVVYGEQINSAKLTEQKAKNMSANAREYDEVLKKSRFCLCPSGSGPNSIRFWEALALGVMPILISEDLDVPKLPLNIKYLRWKETDFETLIPKLCTSIEMPVNRSVPSNQFLDYLIEEIQLLDSNSGSFK